MRRRLKFHFYRNVRVSLLLYNYYVIHGWPWNINSLHARDSGLLRSIGWRKGGNEGFVEASLSLVIHENLNVTKNNLHRRPANVWNLEKLKCSNLGFQRVFLVCQHCKHKHLESLLRTMISNRSPVSKYFAWSRAFGLHKWGYANLTYMVWFNLILSSNFIFFCFWVL